MFFLIWFDLVEHFFQNQKNRKKHLNVMWTKMLFSTFDIFFLNFLGTLTFYILGVFSGVFFVFFSPEDPANSSISYNVWYGVVVCSNRGALEIIGMWCKNWLHVWIHFFTPIKNKCYPIVKFGRTRKKEKSGKKLEWW